MNSILRATALVFVASTMSAHAADWYIYSASQNACLRAADFAHALHLPPAASPGAWSDAMRRYDHMPTLDVVRDDDDGSVQAVGVTTRLPSGEKTTMIWFADRARCEMFAIGMRARGLAASPEELR